MVSSAVSRSDAVEEATAKRTADKIAMDEAAAAVEETTMPLRTHITVAGRYVDEDEFKPLPQSAICTFRQTPAGAASHRSQLEWCPITETEVIAAGLIGLPEHTGLTVPKLSAAVVVE